MFFINIFHLACHELLKKRGTRHQRQILGLVNVHAVEIHTLVGNTMSQLIMYQYVVQNMFHNPNRSSILDNTWASMFEENWDHLYVGFMSIQPFENVISESAW